MFNDAKQLDGNVAVMSMLYARSFCALDTGDLKSAQEGYDKLLQMPGIDITPNLHWAALYDRGRISEQQGKPDEAIEYYRKSIEIIERLRSNIALEASKIGFVGDKQAVYGGLFRLLASKDDWNAAFDVAERAKARALVDLLAQKNDLTTVASPDENIQALLTQATTSELANGLMITAEQFQGTRSAARSAQQTLTQTAPQVASLVTVTTVPTQEIRQRLGKGEVLVNYYLSGTDLYALILGDNDVSGIMLDGTGLDKKSANSAIKCSMLTRTPMPWRSRCMRVCSSRSNR